MSREWRLGQSMGHFYHLTGICVVAALLSGCGENTPESKTLTPQNNDVVDAIILEAPKAEIEAPIPTNTPPAFDPIEIFGHSLPLFATGSEPYWTADIEDGWISFNRPGLALVEVPLVEFDTSQSIITFNSNGLGVELTNASCVDDAGPIQIKLSHRDVEYIGCVVSTSEQTIHSGGDYSWKDLITPSLIAIDGCFAATQGERFVEALYPREPGTVGMILVGADGSFLECGADMETGEVYFVDPMNRNAAEEWLTGAAFARTGKSPACANGAPIDNAGVFSGIGCR